MSSQLITVDEFLQSSGMNYSSVQESFFRAYNPSSGATSATIGKVGNILTLIVVGGANAHSSTFDLTNAAYDTLAELIAAIKALNKGWIINQISVGDQLTADLYDFGTASVLTAATEYTALGFNRAMITAMIEASSDFVERYCKRKFLTPASAITEYYHGDGGQYLQLENYPIVSITSLKLWEYELNAASYTFTEHTEFEQIPESGRIYMAGGFSRGLKNHQVVYKYGYSVADMPEDLKAAVKMLTKQQYQLKDKAGIASETIGRYSVSYGGASTGSGAGAFFMGSAVDPQVLSLLAPYRRLDRVRRY